MTNSFDVNEIYHNTVEREYSSPESHAMIYNGKSHFDEFKNHAGNDDMKT